MKNSNIKTQNRTNHFRLMQRILSWRKWAKCKMMMLKQKNPLSSIMFRKAKRRSKTMMTQRSMTRTWEVIKLMIKERQLSSITRYQKKEKKEHGNPKIAFSRKIHRILTLVMPLLIRLFRCLKRPQSAWWKSLAQAVPRAWRSSTCWWTRDHWRGTSSKNYLNM